nr:unnamed protein product [Salmo salar]
MARRTAPTSVPVIGLANTVRFAWKEKDMEPFGRETFGRNLLMGVLQLRVEDVFCLHDNPLEGAFEVTLHTEEKHEETMQKVRRAEKEKPMCHYAVTNLARNNFRVVTINMYNPHVKEEDVRAFLGRFMDGISSARLLKDTLGFWTGRRSYQALLREDPKGLGGYLHPPAMFSLGADRGTLYYARQPPFCRRCMAYGHILASCSTKKCRYCGSAEHGAGDCDAPKACHGCGMLTHLWRECPARQRSYASAAGGGARAGDGGRRGDPEPRTGTEGADTQRGEEEKTEAGEGKDKEEMGIVVPEEKEAKGEEEKGVSSVEGQERTVVERKETEKASEGKETKKTSKRRETEKASERKMEKASEKKTEKTLEKMETEKAS